MEIRKILILLLAALTLASCGDDDETPNAPSPLLSEDEMVSVITDVQFAEGILNYERNTGKTTVGLKEVAFDSIFAHHGITDSIFYANIDFYNRHPNNMNGIMKRVVDSLLFIKSNLDSLNKIDSLYKVKIDSLNKVKIDSLSRAYFDSLCRTHFDSLSRIHLDSLSRVYFDSLGKIYFDSLSRVYIDSLSRVYIDSLSKINTDSLNNSSKSKK